MPQFETRQIADKFHLRLNPSTTTMRRCPSRSATIEAIFDVKASVPEPLLLRATYSLWGYDTMVRIQVIGDCATNAVADISSDEATSPLFKATPGGWTRVCHRLVICARGNTPVEGLKWLYATLWEPGQESYGANDALYIGNQISI